MADMTHEERVEALRCYEFRAADCGDRTVLKLTAEEALTAAGLPELEAEVERLREVEASARALMTNPSNGLRPPLMQPAQLPVAAMEEHVITWRALSKGADDE